MVLGITILVFVLSFPKETSSAPEVIVAIPKKIEWTFDTFVSHLAKKYSQDEVLVRKIIKCESQYKKGNTHENLDKDGNVWSIDWGYWQINDYWHLKDATKQGYDIRYNWQHNLEFGFKLMKQQGTRPWSASKHCWNK